MTGQDRPQALADVDNDESVVRYLEAHPDFLADNPHLLPLMSVPHEFAGNAVSLIEAQVQALRQRNAQLHEHLNALVDNARTNEELAMRLHRLVLSLIENPALDEVFATLYQGLEESFGANCVTVRVFAEARDNQDRGLAELVGDWPHRALFEPLIRGGKPQCGPLQTETAHVLFGDRADQVASAALLPLMLGEHGGVLAIGSRNSSHFHASMGTMYLRQLADVVARLLVNRVR